MKWVLVYVLLFGPWEARTGAESLTIEFDDLSSCNEFGERLQLLTGARAPNTGTLWMCLPKGTHP